MNKIYHQDGLLKKWSRKLRSPVSNFYLIDMKPETIYQEMMESGKPVALYEKLLVQAFLIIFLALVLLGATGIRWNILVSGVGLIVTLPFLVVEIILFRWRSFTRDVKRVRTIIVFLMIIISIYLMNFL